MSASTQKMGRRNGWATASSMLLLLAGTCRAQTPNEVTVDANGATSETWAELTKHEVEHATKHGGVVSHMLERGKEFRHSRDRDVDRYYPANRIYDRIFKSDLACEFLQLTRAGLIGLLPNMTSTINQRVPWPVAGVDLPQDLQDMRPIPFEFGDDVKQRERPTYYWAFRAIQNVYSYAQRHWYGEPMIRIPGWTDQKAHFFHEDLLHFKTFEWTPMGATMYNADRETVFLVFRGTMSRQEWFWDFQYHYAEGSARSMFPGRVSTGPFTVFQLLRESVMDEVKRLKPKRVIVTGHSLGGGLSILFSSYIKSQFPDVTVDCLAFAAVPVGDKTFFEAFHTAVNLRTIFYLGPGWDGDYFRAGDVIPQPGHSAAFPGCPGMSTGNEEDEWQYELPGGFIRFTSEEMPNPETWKFVENTMVTTYIKLIAAHVCSYLCWTAHLYDADSHCYFQVEKEGLPDGAYCNIKTIVGQLITNTGVRKAPLTPPNRKLIRGGG